ncbi:MAG TPA: hypothetical protein VK327_18840 [Candidatus Paceibacterota bacterium]|nr:hypothetical protein [Candidatus Paceibacterota bacterium]
MRQQKFTPRADYRQQENQRIQASATLAEKFHDLKSLTVEFGYFSAEGISRNSQIKYTVNPDHAKSVFRLDCPNQECVGGDFDLSQALAKAVSARETTVMGEMCCEGWLSKTTIDRIHCHNIVRYKLSLEYGARPAKPKPQLQPVGADQP